MADPESRTRGNAPGLVMYTSEQAHSSVEKAGITLGIGQDNIRKIPVDDAFRMRVDILREMVAAIPEDEKTRLLLRVVEGSRATPSVPTLGRATLEAAKRAGPLLEVLDEVARPKLEQAAADAAGAAPAAG